MGEFVDIYFRHVASDEPRDIYLVYSGVDLGNPGHQRQSGGEESCWRIHSFGAYYWG